MRVLKISLFIVSLALVAPFAQAQQDFAESEAIPAVTSTGTITTFAGGGVGCTSEADTLGDGCAAANATLKTPAGVAVAANGDIYIADTQNYAIRKVDHTTGVISIVAGRGSCYAGGPGSYCGDGGPAGDSHLAFPTALAFDVAGDLYIADSSVIRKIDHETGVITRVAGDVNCKTNPCSVYSGYSGDGGAATLAMLDQPWGLAIDPAGNIFIADTLNGAVRLVSEATGKISTYAGRGTGCKGQLDLFADGCPPADLPELGAVRDVALDAKGNIYITDVANTRVRKVDAKTGLVSTVAGGGTGCTGQLDGYGDGCPGPKARILSPHSITFSQAGDMYFTDTGRNVVLKVGAATGVISQVVGNGIPGHTGDGGPANFAELDFPCELAFDASSQLYIADYYTNAIRKVVFPAPPATAAPTFTPKPGTFHSTQQVHIADSNANATIYYTIDGSIPNKGSRQYGGPIAVTESTTVKAMAMAPGLAASTVSTGKYTIARPPVVTTKAATAISTAKATLNGTVADEGLAGQVWFVYGTTKTALTKTTPRKAIAAASAAHAATATLTGLMTKKTYYFKAEATTAGGTVSGSILSFETK